MEGFCAEGHESERRRERARERECVRICRLTSAAAQRVRVPCLDSLCTGRACAHALVGEHVVHTWYLLVCRQRLAYSQRRCSVESTGWGFCASWTWTF
jgi:hypothetical protein